MATKKYLDLSGLTTFFTNLQNTFVLKTDPVKAADYLGYINNGETLKTNSEIDNLYQEAYGQPEQKLKLACVTSSADSTNSIGSGVIMNLTSEYGSIGYAWQLYFNEDHPKIKWRQRRGNTTGWSSWGLLNYDVPTGSAVFSNDSLVNGMHHRVQVNSNGQLFVDVQGGSGNNPTPGYTLPKATNIELGGIKIGYSENGKNYPVELDSNGKAFVNVPWASGGSYTLSKATNSKLGGIKAVNREGTIIFPTNITSMPSNQGAFVTQTPNRYYAVQTDSDGKAFVNIPWEKGGDNTPAYELPIASSTLGGIKAQKNEAVINVSYPNVNSPAIGIQTDINGTAFVKVPGIGPDLVNFMNYYEGVVNVANPDQIPITARTVYLTQEILPGHSLVNNIMIPNNTKLPKGRELNIIIKITGSVGQKYDFQIGPGFGMAGSGWYHVPQNDSSNEYSGPSGTLKNTTEYREVNIINISNNSATPEYIVRYI